MAYWDEQKDQQKSREARGKDRASDNGEKS
jgi:hypothetical protein